MSEYVAPLKDMKFALKLAGMDEVAALPGFEEASEDLVQAVLEEASKFAHGVLSPRTGKATGTAPFWKMV